MNILKFVKLSKEKQIECLEKEHLKLDIDNDLFEVEGSIDNVDILCNEDNEKFIITHFNKGGIWNENSLIIYDEYLTPLGKLAYAYNKDGRVSFDYFYVKKVLRGQHLGQFMINYFLKYIKKKVCGDIIVFTNPYSFDVTFNGVKSYDYESQLSQYKLEQFYLNNGFVLTETPKKYVFGDYNEDANIYNLTKKPTKMNFDVD